MSNILCIGEVNLDVIAVISSAINYGSDTAAKVSMHGGGAGGNVAAWLRVAGAQSHMLARIGQDSAGALIRSEFDRLGVTYSQINVAGAPTGTVVVIVDSDGERSMFPDKGANSGFRLSDLPELSFFNAAYISGYSLLDPKSSSGILQMIGKIKSAGLKIYFDPATVGGMAGIPIAEIRSWINQMHCLLLNEDEAKYLSSSNDLAVAMADLLTICPTVLIKRGAAGVTAANRNLPGISLPAVAAEVIDTTGAGDSFAAGFIAADQAGLDFTASLGAALTMAAKCVAIVGARPALDAQV
jgi:sugar/nucleoside kinase (ribokinase family)